MKSPSRTESVLVWLVSAIIFAVVVCHFQSYMQKVDDFGDNGAYLNAGSAIRHWDFRNVVVKQFWGLSYVVALLSFSAVSLRTALLLTCAACSLISVLLVYQLWGGWIAGYFTVLNFDWLQRSYLGGAEPLFTALLFASFLCTRRERWVWAATLAALASVVRPLGIFALVAIGLVLLFRREYRRFLACTAVGVMVGGLYVLPFWLYFHDALYQVHRYQTSDWHSGRAFAWPFRALGSSLLHNQAPLTNVVLTLGWIGFVVIGFLAMGRADFRTCIRQRLPEFLFAFLYLAFLLTYNSEWAWADFPRFAIPLVPFALAGLEPWVPKSRVALYAVCILGSVLAACSAIGIRNVLPVLR